jgi:hypothetical protein
MLTLEAIWHGNCVTTVLLRKERGKRARLYWRQFKSRAQGRVNQPAFILLLSARIDKLLTDSSTTRRFAVCMVTDIKMSTPAFSQVRVGVRVRPITAKEQDMGSSSILTEPQTNCIALSGRRCTYRYDVVFDAATSQSDLYAQVSPPLLEAFFDGYNATVSVYICWSNLRLFSSAHSS